MFIDTETKKENADRCRENLLDEAAKLLLKAADLIEDRGLPSCGLDHLGRGCVIVTLGELNGRLPCAVVDDAIQRLHKAGVECIPQWSDQAGAEGRAAEVVAKLRSVALGGER